MDEMKTEDEFEAVCVDKLSLLLTCRTCLNTDPDQKLTSIFEDTEPSATPATDLLSKLSLLKLKIAKDDGYPPQVCSICVERLMAVDVFQKQCQKAQDYLEKYFVKVSPEEVSEVKPETIVCSVEVPEISTTDSRDSPQSLKAEDDENEEQENDVGFGIGGDSSSSEYKPENEESSSEDETLADLKKQISKEKDTDKPKCSICGKVFRTIANRNCHQRLHTDVNAFPCDKCNLAFKTKRYLRVHKLVHKVGDYTCPVCGKKFTRTSQYEYHVRTHGLLKTIKCRYCDKLFTQYSQRKNHEQMHSENPVSYLCSVCGKSYRHDSSLRNHILKHQKGKNTQKFPCEICHKEYATKNNLKLHLAIHSNIRDYQCEQCGKSFTHESTLKGHMVLHTADKPHDCLFCNESFLRLRELKRHNLMVHAKTDRRIQFDDTLQQENGVGDGDNEPAEKVPAPPPVKAVEKPSKKRNTFSYSCEMCSKTCKTPSALAKHIKGHNEERKFQCVECGSGFKALEHLKRHIDAIHLKLKLFSCEVCSKSFSRMGDLNVHMRSHSNERAHKCSYCGKGFNLAKALRSHVRRHTGERPFVCIICNAAYTCHKNLASHTRRIHAEDPQVLKKVDELAQTMEIIPRTWKRNDQTTAAEDETSAAETKSETH